MPELPGAVPIRIVEDPVKDLGPLAGMLAALEAAANECCLVVSVDTPLVEPKLLGVLIERLGAANAAIPEVEGKRQPLVAAYKRSGCVPTIRQCLESGELRVQNAVALLPQVATVPEGELRVVNPGLRSFKGANTREELAALEAILGRR